MSTARGGRCTSESPGRLGESNTFCACLIDSSAMKPTCIRHTEIPSSTRLFTDFLYDFERVRPYYGRPPELDEFASAAAEVKLDPEHRRALVESLRRQNAGCGEETARGLDLLAEPGTVAVTTGQQIGLFGGPSFAVYKALTAVKFAEALRARGVPAVPVFWLATEDHDLAEVDHAWLLDRENEPLRVGVETRAEPQQPVGEAALAESAPAQLREAVTSAFRELPYGEFASQLASECYGAGADLRSAFRAMFQKLFNRFGLILIDPMDAELRKLAAPTIRAAVEGAAELNHEIIARGEELEQAGYHAQSHVTAETSPVFLFKDGRRTTLKLAAGGYSDGEQSYTVAQLAALVDEAPERFSPNVLLRPVIQDFLLPTAVYVTGPAESAYLAQAEVLYRRLLGRMPAPAPRASFTILDARAERYLDRYGLGVLDCFQSVENLRRGISGSLIPPSLEKAFDESERTINASLDAIDADLTKFDPTLSASLANVRKKMLYQFGKVRSTVARESLRRDDRAGREAAHLANLIFPNGTLQERSFSALSFLARHGDSFLDRIHELIHTDCHDHQVVVI